MKIITLNNFIDRDPLFFWVFLVILLYVASILIVPIVKTTVKVILTLAAILLRSSDEEKFTIPRSRTLRGGAQKGRPMSDYHYGYFTGFEQQIYAAAHPEAICSPGPNRSPDFLLGYDDGRREARLMLEAILPISAIVVSLLAQVKGLKGGVVLSISALILLVCYRCYTLYRLINKKDDDAQV